MACAAASLRAERREAVLDKQRGDRGALLGDRLRCLELINFVLQLAESRPIARDTSCSNKFG